MDRIREMTSAQLQRAHDNLYARLGYGGRDGWNMPTIRLVHPAIFNSLERVRREMARRIGRPER